MAKLFLLARYDPVAELLAQETCEQKLDTTLDELLGLVRIAKMPEETRLRLTKGIAHLRSHINAELQQLQSDRVGRNC